MSVWPPTVSAVKRSYIIDETTYIVDDNRCSLSTVFYVVELVVQTAMVACILLLAWRVRHVYDEFNEARVSIPCAFCLPRAL